MSFFYLFFDMMVFQNAVDISPMSKIKFNLSNVSKKQTGFWGSSWS